MHSGGDGAAPVISYVLVVVLVTEGGGDTNECGGCVGGNVEDASDNGRCFVDEEGEMAAAEENTVVLGVVVAAAAGN